MRASSAPGEKTRVVKVRVRAVVLLDCSGPTRHRAQNDFTKHMPPHLLRLRKAEKERRLQMYGTTELPDEEYSSGEEDEYHDRTTRPAKRRKSLFIE